MAKYNEPESPSINIIGSSTLVRGNVDTRDDIRIDGTLEGKLHSKGKVIIGTSGKVKGEIICLNADFSGTAEADITVTELLMIRSTAIITGEIKAEKLAIEPGAKFNGNCNLQKIDIPLRADTPASKEKQFMQSPDEPVKNYNHSKPGFFNKKR